MRRNDREVTDVTAINAFLADEKKAALDCIMKQQTDRKEWEYSDEMLNKTALFRVTVEQMSCKAK